MENIGNGNGFYIPCEEYMYTTDPLKFNFNGLTVNIKVGIMDSRDQSFYDMPTDEININQYAIQDTFTADENFMSALKQWIDSLDYDNYATYYHFVETQFEEDEIGSVIYPCVWFEVTTNVADTNYSLTLQKQIAPIDSAVSRSLPIKLVSHQQASNFFSSPYNLPWIKIPVCYIEDEKLYIIYDPVSLPKGNTVRITYITKPNKFVKDNLQSGGYTFFNWPDSINTPSEYQFECNDTVAEELVSLAVAFALENVESARLNAKLNMRGLEA